MAVSTFNINWLKADARKIIIVDPLRAIANNGIAGDAVVFTFDCESAWSKGLTVIDDKVLAVSFNVGAKPINAFRKDKIAFYDLDTLFATHLSGENPSGEGALLGVATTSLSEIEDLAFDGLDTMYTSDEGEDVLASGPVPRSWSPFKP